LPLFASLTLLSARRRLLEAFIATYQRTFVSPARCIIGYAAYRREMRRFDEFRLFRGAFRALPQSISGFAAADVAIALRAHENLSASILSADNANTSLPHAYAHARRAAPHQNGSPHNVPAWSPFDVNARHQVIGPLATCIPAR